MALATANSGFFAMLSALSLAFLPLTAHCQSNNSAPIKPPDRAQSAARIHRVYQEASEHYKQEHTNTEVAWQFARACYDEAEIATNNTERATVGNLGISACESLITRQSNSAPAHYYLGMNLGQLARTKHLGALKIVSRMEKHFLLAANLDSSFDHAGPDRCLGLLYEQAPVIGSVGSRTKARKHLQRAVDLAGDFPENRLNLLEAMIKWKDHKAARSELKSIEEIWTAAREKYPDSQWAAEWYDWHNRLESAKKKVVEPARKQ
jgi:hypothetical protein